MKVVKLSKYSIGGAVAYYLIQFLSLPVGILFATYLSWSLTIGEILFALLIAVMLYNGISGVYRLYSLIVDCRIRAELCFDGTTVTIRGPGEEAHSFTKFEIQAYFPDRNEVLLSDGRHISLPCSMPQMIFNEIKMTKPWVNAWWPDLDLPAAIREAGGTSAWKHLGPFTVNFLGLILFGYAAYVEEANSLLPSITLMVAGFILMVYVPDAWERSNRRKAVIHFPCGDSGATRRRRND